MISGRKFFWMALVLYALTVYVPALFLDSDIVTSESVVKALVACTLFLAGLALGSRLFEMSPADPGLLGDHDYRAGFRLLARLLLLLVVYVAIVGPRSPMLDALLTGDSFGAALAREDAVKLNPDRVFVRLYVLTRDVVAPVTLTLAIGVLARWRDDPRSRAWAVAALVGAVYIALWSGQKATIVNYVIAAFLYWQTDARSTLRRLLVVLPLGFLLVVLTFFVMQPELFTRDYDFWLTVEVFAGSIIYRILTVPLEVAAIYVHALDVLGIIRPSDALPAHAWVWLFSEQSIESKIGVEFFHHGIDSSHSNSLAFSYAYVAGGYLGCLAGGIAMVALLRWSLRIVSATGSRFLVTGFSAYLCYLVIDLLNGNYLQYLLNNVVFAAMVWFAAQTVLRPWLRRPTGVAAAPSTP